VEIHVSTTFWEPLTQNKFIVRTIDEKGTKEYKCSYEAGEWNFKMYGEDKLILESQRIKLSGKETFLGRQEYRIIWEGKQIGILKKSFMNKQIIAGNECYPFPRLFRPNISALNLTFPFSALIWRRKVRSYCLETEPSTIMLSIAITIYVWFTWNAIPAD
jgi:hypothetical protein